MRRTIDLSTALVGIGAIAVLVSLFLDWYSPGLRAWDVFEIVDWALFGLAIAALVVLAVETTGAMPPSQRLGWICGILAVIVIAQLLDPPPAAHGATREIGAWVALGGGALMVAGAVMAMAELSVTIGVAGRERRLRTSAVDAREDAEGSEPAAPSPAAPAAPSAPSAPAKSSDLWQSPADRRAAEAAPDPDKTQPLSPVDRPDEE